MRKWLALLIGTAALALAGTALALAGSSEGEGAIATDTTVGEERVSYSYESLDFESVPDGMIEDDELPERPKPAEQEPVDDNPPDIVILHPEDGQVFEQNEVVFEGKTEPGAHVYSGDHEADVSEDGAWRLLLVLEKGENVIIVKAVDKAGNVGNDRVNVIYEAPKPKPEPKVEPREEPKDEKPKDEKPKEEEPKEEEPKEEEPAEWEFSAQQLYGECGETPPFDVFHGTGKPGTVIHIESEYGGGVAEVGEKGGWEIKVIFESAPVNEVFAVHVEDVFGNHKVFEFVHTG